MEHMGWEDPGLLENLDSVSPKLCRKQVNPLHWRNSDAFSRPPGEQKKNDRFAFQKSSSGETPALPSKTVSTPVLDDSLKNFLCPKQSTYQSKRPQGIKRVKPFINNNLMLNDAQKKEKRKWKDSINCEPR